MYRRQSHIWCGQRARSEYDVWALPYLLCHTGIRRPTFAPAHNISAYVTHTASIHTQYIHSDHQWQRTAIAAFEFRSVAAIQDNVDYSDQAPYLAQACESNLTNLSVWLRKTTIAPSLSRATPSVRSFCCMETRAELRMKNPCTYVCMYVCKNCTTRLGRKGL